MRGQRTDLACGMMDLMVVSQPERVAGGALTAVSGACNATLAKMGTAVLPAPGCCKTRNSLNSAMLKNCDMCYLRLDGKTAGASFLTLTCNSLSSNLALVL